LNCPFGYLLQQGSLLSDLRFADFSHSALVRIAEEVCLQQHLLTMGFLIAVRARTGAEEAAVIARKQFTGIAGLTAERLRRCLGLGTDAAALAAVLRVHPALNPLPYTGIEIEEAGERVRLHIPRASGAQTDGTWPALLTAGQLQPLDALARAVDPRYVATGEDTADGLFTDRGIPLPLTVV